MYVKKYLGSYFIVTILFPTICYFATIYGNTMLKGIASGLLIFLAIVIFVYSCALIKYVFSNREHRFIDKEYVIKTNIVVLLLFMLRYVFSNMLLINEIPSVITKFIMMPFILFITVFFMKNYCLNERTIKSAIGTTFILSVVVLPAVIFILEKVFTSENIVFNGVYNRYFIFQNVSNVLLMNILEVLKISLPEIGMVILINGMNIVMWLLLFLPYLVINSIIIDELTYMELCKRLSKFKVVTMCTVMLIMIVICILMCEKGTINLTYDLKHY